MISIMVMSKNFRLQIILEQNTHSIHLKHYYLTPTANLAPPVNRACMPVDCGRKPTQAQGAHANCTHLHTERSKPTRIFEPATCFLQGSSFNYCTAIVLAYCSHTGMLIWEMFAVDQLMGSQWEKCEFMIFLQWP